MILAIDIGNTTTGLAVMQKGEVLDFKSLDSSLKAAAFETQLKKTFKRFLRKGYVFKMVIICSVVPKKIRLVERFTHKINKIDTKVVGVDISVPIKNLYKNPRQVGQDRLVGAYAALRLYGKPIIVIDLGTAITFDVISARREYLGGVIVPGLRLSAESLFLKTALLPRISLKAPRHVIGRTTQDSILSGLFYGYGSLCRGFIELISKQLKARPKVVMTGGHTQLMKKFVSPKIRIIDPFLVHKGMAFLAQQDVS